MTRLVPSNATINPVTSPPSTRLPPWEKLRLVDTRDLVEAAYSAAKLKESSKKSQDAEGQERIYAQTERELRAHL